MTEQKIFFITDSACDIPPQEEAQLDNLCILPIPVTADGEGYYERESFTAEEFYDLIERCKEIPVTSHIPSITFQERYEQAWEKGYTHLVVLLGRILHVPLGTDGKGCLFGGASGSHDHRGHRLQLLYGGIRLSADAGVQESAAGRRVRRGCCLYPRLP